MEIYTHIENILFVIFGTYLIGTGARQNKKVDQFVCEIEFKYKKLNDRLANADIRKGLLSLGQLYGWLAAVSVASFYISARFIDPSSSISKILSVASVLLLFCWISIKWCLNHKKELKKIRGFVICIAFAPLFVGILEHYTEFNYSEPLRLLLSSSPIISEAPFPIPMTQFGFGLSMTIFLIFGLGLYYFMTWFMALPVLVFSYLLVAVPIMFSRLVSVYAPDTPLIGFSIFVVAGLYIF